MQTPNASGSPFSSTLLAGRSLSWRAILIPQALLWGFFLFYNVGGLLALQDVATAELWMGLAEAGVGWPLLSVAMLAASLRGELESAGDSLMDLCKKLPASFNSSSVEMAFGELEKKSRNLAGFVFVFSVLPAVVIGVLSSFAADSWATQLPQVHSGKMLASDVVELQYSLLLAFVWGLAVFFNCCNQLFEPECRQDVIRDSVPATVKWAQKLVTAWQEGRLGTDFVALGLASTAPQLARGLSTESENVTSDNLELSAQLNKLHRAVTQAASNAREATEE